MFKRKLMIIFFLLLGINIWRGQLIAAQWIHGNKQELVKLQIGLTYNEIIDKFGSPDIINNSGNFTFIIYKINEKISYKLKFTLTGRLNCFSIISNGVESILFCDFRIK